MSEAGERLKSSLERFQDAIEGHVPPEAENIMSDEGSVTLRKPGRYRVRFRSNDMQFEAVCRYTGFDVPDRDNDTSILILEFVPEFSYEGPDAQGS